MLITSSQQNHYVTREYFTRTADAAPQRRFTPELKSDDQILRGSFGFLSLQPGLDVHFADTEDLKDLKIDNLCEPRLLLSIVLQGRVKASIGGQAVPMADFDEEANVWRPVASLRAQSVPQRFVRHSRRGDRLRKVNIAISQDWLMRLAEDSDGDFEPLIRFARQELEFCSWHPAPNSVALAEQIISAPTAPAFYHRLYVESRVLGLIADAFNRFCETTAEAPRGNLRPQDRDRLKAIDQYLSAHAGQTVSAAELAGNVGLSVNALRRLVMSARGMSPGKYIRNFMLEYARFAIERDGVSIAEAAYLAGYSSPGNFATAFKRCFGICPSALSEK